MLRGLMQALVPPRSLVALLVAVFTCALGGGARLGAQTPAADGATVGVYSVKFGQMRAPGGGDTWIEAAVELAVTPSTTGGAYARWADSVRVGLSIGIQKRDGGFEFFRATAEAVSLEAGRAVYRFYLPPEIARREQLNSTEPYAWLVDVAVKGTPLEPAATHVSALLATPEALRSFKDRVARSATLNDGVLVPQFESPFANAFAGDTPTFVRR